jgi:type II secretory pathway pseudopilin PulG
MIADRLQVGRGARRRHRRAGFTLVEMMMAILLTVLVFAITIPFFRAQANALDNGAGKMDALQNSRYAQNAMDRELRLAGGVTGQPVIVQAAPFSVTFNVDLVSRVLNDPNSTYYDPGADSLSTESWEPGRAKNLPTTNKSYPPQLYNDANGVQSPAETISFMAYLDASSGRPDIYTLYRRVNDRDSTILARNLWIPVDTNYLFRFYKTDNTGAITMIPMASLPIYWDAANAPADSIRLVEMRVASLYRDVKKATDVIKTVYHKTRLLNAGMLKERTCGSPPLGPPSVTAQKDTNALGQITDINITWTRSLEELGGEMDVATYLVMRKLTVSVDWEVLGNLVANGSASYTYLDTNFKNGTWVYGVVAQDCSPANSVVTSAANLTIP